MRRAWFAFMLARFFRPARCAGAAVLLGGLSGPCELRRQSFVALLDGVGEFGAISRPDAPPLDKGFTFIERWASVLPKPQYVLGAKAHRCDDNPAGGTEHDGLRARFHQPNDVGIQAYGGHCHNDEELVASLRGSKTAMSTPVALATVATIDAHRNNTMNVGSARFRLKPFCVGCPFAPAVFFFARSNPKCQHERDGNDCQGSRELHDGGVIERMSAFACRPIRPPRR